MASRTLLRQRRAMLIAANQPLGAWHALQFVPLQVPRQDSIFEQEAITVTRTAIILVGHQHPERLHRRHRPPPKPTSLPAGESLST